MKWIIEGVNNEVSYFEHNFEDKDTGMQSSSSPVKMQNSACRKDTLMKPAKVVNKRTRLQQVKLQQQTELDGQ